MHFQIKKPQGKLVSVLNGSIFDVAIDLRKNSKTFAQWHGCIYQEKQKSVMDTTWFCTWLFKFSDIAEVLYKTTDYWDKNDEYNSME